MTPKRVIAGRQSTSSVSVWPSRSKSRSRSLRRLTSARALKTGSTHPTIRAHLATRQVDMPVVGLCHSVQGTSRQIAGYLDIPYEEMEWDCAGINHNAWFTRLEHKGEDMYPRLRERAGHKEIYEKDPVRFEMMLHLG